LCDDRLSPCVGFELVETGFHPVRDKKVEKNPSLVLDLRVCRIVAIPTSEKDRRREFPNSVGEVLTTYVKNIRVLYYKIE
jgi:hypothetical protein